MFTKDNLTLKSEINLSDKESKDEMIIGGDKIIKKKMKMKKRLKWICLKVYSVIF